MDFLSWIVLAQAAVALTLAAFAGIVLAFWSLWRMRRDWRVMEAAERFEPVDLTSVVKRYLLPEQQTQRFAEEITVAKQILAGRRPRWRRIAVVCGVLLACGGGAAAYATQRHMQVMALAQPNAKPKLNLDVLKNIEGVWGWRADFLQSCEENPQTITVTPDRSRVSIRYAKPYRSGVYRIVAMEYGVVSTGADTLVLLGPVASTPDKPAAVTVYVQFLDANSFSLNRRELLGLSSGGSSGTIERCPRAPAGYEAAPR